MNQLILSYEIRSQIQNRMMSRAINHQLNIVSPYLSFLCFSQVLIFFIALMMIDRKEMIDKVLLHNPCRILLYDQAVTDEEVEYICSEWKCSSFEYIQFNNSKRQLNGITHKGLLHISRTKWDSLSCLNLSANKIGDKGCKYLTRAYMPNLEYIYLQSNNHGDPGLLHISKGTWPNIRSLCVSSFIRSEDFMREEGCSYLIRGNWKKLFLLSIGRPNLKWKQAKRVLLCEFPLLGIIYINSRQEEMAVKLRQIQQYLKAKLPQLKINS